MSTFSRQRSNLGATIGKYNADSNLKGLRKKLHNTDSVNLNHRVISSTNYNKTQRIFTDSIGMSPKKGVNLVPIRSKQTESLDSFENDNVMEENQIEIIPEQK